MNPLNSPENIAETAKHLRCHDFPPAPEALGDFVLVCKRCGTEHAGTRVSEFAIRHTTFPFPFNCPPGDKS